MSGTLAYTLKVTDSSHIAARQTLVNLRIVLEPHAAWTIHPIRPLPTSLEDISISASALALFTDPHDARARGVSLPRPLTWLSDTTRYLTVTDSFDEDNWLDWAYLTLREPSDTSLQWPCESLVGINASVGSKFAIEQLFPSSAPSVKRLPIIWHVAWQAFVDYMPSWRDFAPPPHSSLAQPHAHHLTALYILPLPYSPIPPHFLDELASRVGPNGDPSLEQLETVFLDKQWKVLFRGRAGLPGRSGRQVEIVFVGGVLNEEEVVVGGGVGKEDVGFPEEMKRWATMRRQDTRAP